MAERAFGKWPDTDFSGAFSSPLIGGQNLAFGNAFQREGKNTIAPTITNVDPPTGTPLPTQIYPVSFDVTDLNPGLQVVLVTVKLVNRIETQVAYNGSNFVAPFNSTRSTVTAIANGLHFEIAPQSIWPGDIEELFVYAMDQDGNVEALP